MRGMLFSCAVLVFSASGMFTQAHHPVRGFGEEWLSWSPEQRTANIGAYLQGYLMGKTDACEAASELFEQHKPVKNLEDDPDRKCFRHAKGYSRSAGDYAGVITAFYQRNPQHLNIPVDYFMLLFTNVRYKTVDDIEQGIQKGDVRTTF